LQVKSDTLENFLDRFGQLNALHGESLVKTCKFSGIARSLFYEIRDQKRTVSDKVWKKLEAAERRAGIVTKSDSNAESSTSPKKIDVSEVTHSSSVKSLRRRSKDRMIPVIGWAHAGEAESYEELPQSWQNEISSECPDPKAFAVSLEGDSMEPRFYDGDILIVQPTTEVHSGCFVVARFASDGVIFRRLEMRGNKIILVPLNSQYESSTHTADEFSWIYPVWARITKMWKR